MEVGYTKVETGYKAESMVSKLRDIIIGCMRNGRDSNGLIRRSDGR